MFKVQLRYIQYFTEGLDLKSRNWLISNLMFCPIGWGLIVHINPPFVLYHLGTNWEIKIKLFLESSRLIEVRVA